MPIERFETDSFNREEEKLLEYVIAVADRFAPDFVIDRNGEAYAVDSQAPRLFKHRYNNKKLNVFFNHSDYVMEDGTDNESVISIVRGLGINEEKFWYLLLFVSDYVVGSTLNTFERLPSPKEEIENLIDFVKSNEDSYNTINGAMHKQPMKLTLQIKGRHLVIKNPNTISAIAAMCKEHVSEIGVTNRLNYGKMKKGEVSDSKRIWLFAKMLRCFFNLYPQFSGQRQTGGSTTKSTVMLISKLAYLTKQTTNPDYDISDENLKGLLKQYRDYKLDTINSIYG